MKKLLFNVALCCFCAGAQAQTPNLDQEKTAIYQDLYRRGYELMPTDAYIIARAELKNEVCGEKVVPRLAVESLETIHSQSNEANAAIVMATAGKMKNRFKVILLAHPEEKSALCKQD